MEMNQLYQGKHLQICYLRKNSSGLGLTTVAHIVKTMNGTISLVSKVGEGSTFIVTLPLSVRENPHALQDVVSEAIHDARTKTLFQIQDKYMTLISKAKAISEASNNVDSRSEIIIAEDNPINRKVLLKMLQSLGHEADYVCDGVELVEKFKVDQHKIVITDLVSIELDASLKLNKNMPNMNGLEAARELRKQYGFDFKIFVLTANVTIVDSYDINEVINRVLTKPCSKKDLMDICSINR